MAVSATPHQLDLARFIAGYAEAHGGVAPSFSECCAALGLASKSGIHRMVNGMEERGLLRRLYQRERAIELLVPIAIPRAPDGAPLHAVPFGKAP